MATVSQVVSPTTGSSECPPTANHSGHAVYGSIPPVFERQEAALLMILGFGGVSVLLALLHRQVRKRVFHDDNNVDTAFDAGGRVSTSLTAVTVASQFLWPGDILQSSTITVKTGISGPLWYTVGAVMNIALFPIVSVYLKTRAPGAKTYLQIMYARYGRAAHILFVVMALMVNLCVIAVLIVAGVSTIKAATVDASDEFCVVIIAVLFGSYSFIGGLGTTFYVSYFNAVLTFSILIALNIKILYSSDSTTGGGNIKNLYAHIQCLQGPTGNENRSYLTFWSENGFVYAFMGLCVSASITYCDQAAWQSRIAAKPLQGVLGFLIAAFIWFAIPISISTSAGLAYIAMAATNTTSVLSPSDIDEGLVTPFMAERLLGGMGSVLILTMIAMTLMSTGSGEVMAVSSIIVYDIYQIYVHPFREVQDAHSCILCGKTRPVDGADEDSSKCYCPGVLTCDPCRRDLESSTERKEGSNYEHKHYTCPHHGLYRQYQQDMLSYKSWCILWVTVAIVPLGIAVQMSGLKLNWTMLNGFVLTLPCFPVVVLSIFWSKTTGHGVIAGAVCGMLGGVGALLGTASTYPGGLQLFQKNTSENLCVMAGAGTSIGLSVIVCFVVSLLTHKIHTDADVENEWRKLRDIDNPLHPWSELYTEDIPDLAVGERPSVKRLEQAFGRARLAAYIGGLATLVLCVGLVPGVMLSLHVLSETQFTVWTHVLQWFCFAMAAVVVVAAPVEEVVQVVRRVRANNSERRQKETANSAYNLKTINSAD